MALFSVCELDKFYDCLSTLCFEVNALMILFIQDSNLMLIFILVSIHFFIHVFIHLSVHAYLVE